MVWGGVSQHHRTELVVIASNLNTVRYREDILLPHVVPFLQAHPDMTLQHGNAGALVEEWGNILQQELPNLVQSMRRRCTEVLNAAGDHTTY